MRKLGQHFLKNKSALQLIAGSLDLTPGDVVIEIGPGHGELTEFLLSSPVSRIVLIEKDERLSRLLIEKFQGDARITVIAGDALNILRGVANVQGFSPHGYKVIGNIPYYITGHLFRILGELDPKPEQCSFTIQKEVAERVCASAPHMNRLAASVQLWARAKIIATLPAGDFSPPPKVSSAIIALTTTEPARPNDENYYIAVRALFAQPRKTLSNNLAGATHEKGDVVAKKLSMAGINPSGRPQNLSVKDILVIAESFFDKT